MTNTKTIDPHDAAEAALQITTRKVDGWAANLASATGRLADARAARSALIRAALADEVVDAATISKGDAAILSRAWEREFCHDVHAAAMADRVDATLNLANEKAAREQRRLAEAQDAINAALHNLVPSQPADDKLDTASLAQVRQEAVLAINAAIEHFNVSARSSPAIKPPHKRLTLEAGDYQTWQAWAGSNPVRQMRVAMATRDHFLSYAHASIMQLVAIGKDDGYHATRAKLPKWGTMIAPCAFVPLLVVV